MSTKSNDNSAHTQGRFVCLCATPASRSTAVTKVDPADVKGIQSEVERIVQSESSGGV